MLFILQFTNKIIDDGKSLAIKQQGKFNHN